MTLRVNDFCSISGNENRPLEYFLSQNNAEEQFIGPVKKKHKRGGLEKRRKAGEYMMMTWLCTH